MLRFYRITVNRVAPAPDQLHSFMWIFIVIKKIIEYDTQASSNKYSSQACLSSSITIIRSYYCCTVKPLMIKYSTYLKDTNHSNGNHSDV